jgi:transposase
MIDVAKTLPEDPKELRVFTQLLLAEFKSQALLITKLRHQLAGHNHHRYGSKSETIEQLQLALETSEIATAAMTAKLRLPDEDTLKGKPKRRPIPDHIPRQHIELTTGDDACAECGGKLRRLGEDVTEELEYVPGRFIVNRITRPRFACSCCDHFTQAQLPSRPIERGRPGPGLLAHVLVNKYADHLPLYRQSQIFERDGLDLDRSTLADWVGKSTALLEPLANAIGRHVQTGQALFADDTPVKMLAPGAGKTQTARFWTYVRDERPWSSDAPPAAWYQFSPDRKGQHPKDHLKSYRGWMHADGYAGFEHIYRAGDIREVACMAHIRRKFVDVHRAQGSAIAEEAIHRIACLYAIEKEARGSPPEQRTAIRQAKAKPIIDDLINWLGVQLPAISGKSPLAGAIRYALTRLPRLKSYLDHGYLEIDNNAAERAIRGIAVGRKNYLFVGSQAGGKAAAIAYTLIETAKLNGVDPQAWLADTLACIPDYKITKIDDLLPWNHNRHDTMKDAA